MLHAPEMHRTLTPRAQRRMDVAYDSKGARSAVERTENPIEALQATMESGRERAAN